MCDKMRILFVDDEPRILDGLRRMLRFMRREWSMAFAGGGEEALGVLSAEPIDVVVSDIRMPGMDGVTLLKEVRKRHPHIVRIALSGQAAKETVLSSVGLVHQYQAKPCDAEILRTTLTRIRALGELLKDEQLKAKLASMTSAPSLPEAHSRLIGQLRSPDTSVDQVARTISQSPGMSARIVQLVSSAFFARPVDVLTPSGAVDFLGLDIIKAMAPSEEAFSRFSPDAVAAAPLDAIEEHSLIVAEGARQIAIAENADRDFVSQTFMAGLFHDIGKMILAELSPEKSALATSAATGEAIGICEAERRLFGTTHARAGAYLLGIWGLPEPVVEALAYHHDPSETNAGGFSPLTAVHVADVLAHEIGAADASEATRRADQARLSNLDLTDRLPAWREAFHRAMYKETANV